MATRSDTPVEAVPAIGALGQEAVVAAALAAPQISEQIAALPEAPPAAPLAFDQLAAAPAGDAVPPPLAADQAGLPTLPDVTAPAPAADLAPVMGALAPMTAEVAGRHTSVTT